MKKEEPEASPVPRNPREMAVSIVVLTIAAIVSSFTLFKSYVHIINFLPRPMQGENVMIPWPMCVAGYLIVPAILPWLALLPFNRHRGQRLYFSLCLFCAVLVWYYSIGFDSLLDKAYRRGL